VDSVHEILCLFRVVALGDLVPLLDNFGFKVDYWRTGIIGCHVLAALVGVFDW
jgi:hypothetical protein